MAGIEELSFGDLSLHQYASMLLIVFTAQLFVFGWLRKRWKRLDDFLTKAFPPNILPDKYKMAFMAVMTVAGAFLYLYCWMCQITESDGIGDDRAYLDWLFRDLLGILPWFIWGCIIAGFVVKYMSIGKIKFPKSMVGAGALGALLPICSCAAVPLAHGLILGKQIRVRTIITFLIVVPVLSPIVMILAISQIGWQYLVVEVASVFVLAMTAGVLVEKYAGIKEQGDCRQGCYSCKGCKTSSALTGRDSALLAAWDQFLYLMKYIFLGLIIGSAISVYAEPETLKEIFGSAGDFWGSIPGLVLIVCMGIPLFICSGEDVLILAPLLAAGSIPLGHAVAFAITGNAICITAIPVLTATFGKRVTTILVATFFVGSIVMGLIINSLVWAFG